MQGDSHFVTRLVCKRGPQPGQGSGRSSPSGKACPGTGVAVTAPQPTRCSAFSRRAATRRSRLPAGHAAQEVRTLGSQVLAVPAGVGEPAAVEHLVQRTLDTYGHLDAALNNAGATFPPTPLANGGPRKRWACYHAHTMM